MPENVDYLKMLKQEFNFVIKQILTAGSIQKIEINLFLFLIFILWMKQFLGPPFWKKETVWEFK